MKTPSLTAGFSARGISYLMTKVFLQKNNNLNFKNNDSETNIYNHMLPGNYVTCERKKSELTYAFPNLCF